MRARVAAVGEGTHAVLAPAFGWAIFCSIIAAIKSGMAHMPLPIWACPTQPAGQANQHVVVLISIQPGTGFHVTLAHHRPGMHGRVHFIAGSVKKTGVYKSHARTGQSDTRFQIHAGTPLFVHDTELDGIRG